MLILQKKAYCSVTVKHAAAATFKVSFWLLCDKTINFVQYNMAQFLCVRIVFFDILNLDTHLLHEF